MSVPKRTTLARMLSHVFSELEKHIPSTNNGLTLFQAWKNVLGPDQEDLVIVGRIGDLSTALLKLESQILASERLEEPFKISALNTTANFKVLFSVQHFSSPAIAVRASCDRAHWGNLGIIGLSIEPEFSEPKLEKSDIEEVAAILNEVKEIISGSTIELVLRVNLRRQIELMLWWLKNPEIASVQDLFESIGSAMMIARQVELSVASKTADAATGKGIFNKLASVASRFADMLNIANRNVEAGDKLTTNVTHFLEHFQSSPPPS